MGKGDYRGGSTVVGPRSGWFSFRAPKAKAKVELQPALSEDELQAKQKRSDNFFAMLQRTTKLSTSALKANKRRRKKNK